MDPVELLLIGGRWMVTGATVSIDIDELQFLGGMGLNTRRTPQLAPQGPVRRHGTATPQQTRYQRASGNRLRTATHQLVGVRREVSVDHAYLPRILVKSNLTQCSNSTVLKSQLPLK